MDSREGGPRDVRPNLSERERQLLVLAAQGLTDNAIAHRLGISLATVGTYWGRVRIKLGPLSRTELVANFLREEASLTMESLKDENRRLLSELEENAHLAEKLKTSVDLFRGLIDTAPDAIIVVDQDGVVQLANQQAEDLFGYGHGELTQVRVSDLMPEEYRSSHDDHRRNYNANPQRRRMGEHLATWALRRDGTRFRMATALSASSTPNGMLITCIVREMPELSVDAADALTA